MLRKPFILVVVGHYIPDNSPAWYVMLHDVIYTFHMPLFMFTSGYVYIATKKEIPYGVFLLKKVRRLMLPYLTTSIVVIVIKLLTQGGMRVDNPVTFFSFVEMFYMPAAGYFLWFIWALWWMFVLVPLFKRKQDKAVLFGLSILLHFIPIGLPQVFCLREFSVMLMYFMLGVFVFEHDCLNHFLKTFNRNKVIYASVAFILGQSLYFLDVLSIGNFNKKLLFVVLPFVGIWFIIEIAKVTCRNWINNHETSFLMRVVESSYIIYLFHTTFEGFVKAVLRKFSFDSGMWYVFIPATAFVILCGVVFPMLLHRIVLKKYRMTKLLFGEK